MSKGSARGPEGKTGLPHKIGLREGAIDLKPRKMGCPFPRTVGSVLPWWLFSGKGRPRGRNYSRAVSGPCCSRIFLSLNFSSGKPWSYKTQNTSVCSSLQGSLPWASVLVNTGKTHQKQSLLEQSTHISPRGFFLHYETRSLSHSLTFPKRKAFSHFLAGISPTSPRLLPGYHGSLESFCALCWGAAHKVR